jgi:hypothetical protein
MFKDKKNGVTIESSLCLLLEDMEFTIAQV